MRTAGVRILALAIFAPFLVAAAFDDVAGTRHNLVGAPGKPVCEICHFEVGPASPLSPFYRAAGPRGYNLPTGPSLSCVACHDGAVATDSHAINVDDPRLGAPSVEFREPAQTRIGRFLFGDGPGASRREAPPLMKVDHPISIPYPRRETGTLTPADATVTLSRYWSIPDRKESGIALPTGPVSSYLPLPQGPPDPEASSSLVRTTAGAVHCDSCHNPHKNTIRPFLRMAPSALCLSCHDR